MQYGVGRVGSSVEKRGCDMNELFKLLVFVLAYVVLMKWVLPWLGAPT